MTNSPPPEPYTLARFARRLLERLVAHPAWPAYLERSFRAQAHYYAALEVVRRLEAGEAAPEREVDATLEGVARTLGRLDNFHQTGSMRDG